MILYLCLNCGRWYDMSLVDLLKNSLDKIMDSLTNNPQSKSDPFKTLYYCPECHRILTEVKPTDRLKIFLSDTTRAEV